MMELPKKTSRFLHLLLICAVLLLPFQGMAMEGMSVVAGLQNPVSELRQAPIPHEHGMTGGHHMATPSDQACHNSPAFAGDHCAGCVHYCAIQRDGLVTAMGESGDEYQQFSVAVITVNLPHEIRPPIL